MATSWTIRRWGVVALKSLAVRTRLRNWVFFRYTFMFTPAQLGYLCDEVSATADVPGALLEVGCAYGLTTVWLNRHLDDLGVEKPYHCLDTFSGFVPEHVEHERHQRGHAAETYPAFRTNDPRWFEVTMEVNRIRRVVVHQADAATFDYSGIGPISFALIDVDLYLPVLGALRRVWPLVSEGGVVLVDDCEDGRYDGARQAYEEFAKEIGAPVEIVHGCLGVLRKVGSGV